MTKTPAPATISSSPLNIMALVGFILSLWGAVVGITVIPGIVLSHIGMSQIKRTGESGRGFGIAGLIVGYCLVGLTVLAVIAVMMLAILFPLVFLSFFAALRSSMS